MGIILWICTGAIQAAGNTNLAILNSTFTNNVGLSAGAISAMNSTIFVNGSTFVNNTGQQVGCFFANSASALKQKFIDGRTY